MRLAIALLSAAAVEAFVPASVASRSARLQATGDRWYCGEGVKSPRGASGMPAKPPEEAGGGGHNDDLFNFWADTNYDYEVALERPLGIVFEELGTASSPRGVKVVEVAAGSNAAASGKVSVGDVLVGLTAVRYMGGEYLGKARPERDIFPAGQMDFDTVVDAIGSNEAPEKSELKVVEHSSDVILRMSKGN